MGMIWAVPHCTMLLAHMGAEVIKVESIQHYDAVRGIMSPSPAASLTYPGGDPGPRPWHRAPYGNDTNLSKKDITCNIQHPKGKELFKQLVAKSDVVTENFAYGVVERLGLGYDVLREVKPDIVMISAPGYGANGPESSYVAYGANQWQMTGMANITGYSGEGPLQGAINYGDPTAGLHVAGYILAALYHRNRTGKGQFIDFSQREAGIGLIGEAILDYVMNDRVWGRMGNRHPAMAPHGAYRCSGDDNWVAIAVRDDVQFVQFCNIIGQPALADDERFADAVSRYDNQDELNIIIGEWTKDRDHYDVMNLLQKEGIPAGAVVSIEQLFVDPHIKATEFYKPVTHPDIPGEYLYSDISYEMSRTPGDIQSHPPMLGEHNEYVFKDILGLSEAEYQELEREQIIGKEPLPGADGIPVATEEE
jgi:crotonobetainyl-CoA:carnitine CoA-transferase CaiB-like acyl-CoA transferase